MEFTYKVSEAEFLSAWKLRERSFSSRLFRGVFLFVGFWVVVLVGLILLWGVVQYTGASPMQHPSDHPAGISRFLGAMALNLGPFFVAFGILAFVAIRLGPQSSRRSYRNDPQMQGEFTVDLTPDSISIQNSVGTSSRSGWSLYKYWREGKDLLLLGLHSGELFVLSLAGLSEPQRDELRSILGAALPRK